jgi:hypothetical protein
MSERGGGRRSPRLPAACIVLVSALSLAADAGAGEQPQESRRASALPAGASMQWLSPAVVVSWIIEPQPDASEHVRLIVLWRGTPGWFMRPGGSTATDGSSAGQSHHVITQGGVRLTLDYDPSARVATIQGRSLALGQDNVVFVDDVDSAAGPRVTGTGRVPRALPGSAGQIGLVLRKSPEVVAFLRCDAVLPDPGARAVLGNLCLQNLGVTGVDKRPGASELPAAHRFLEPSVRMSDSATGCTVRATTGSSDWCRLSSSHMGWREPFTMQGVAAPGALLRVPLAW